MAKLTSKERELIIQALYERTEELKVKVDDDYYEESWSKSEIKTLERGFEKLEELFEAIYG